MGDDRGFGGEIAGFYHQYRRGYPPAVIDALTAAFGLTRQDIVIDVGCGNGQLTVPIARRVQAAAGIDPEPGMLARARQAAAEQDVTNVSWCSAPTPTSPRWLRCWVTAAPGRSPSPRPCTGCATAS